MAKNNSGFNGFIATLFGILILGLGCFGGKFLYENYINPPELSSSASSSSSLVEDNSSTSEDPATSESSSTSSEGPSSESSSSSSEDSSSSSSESSSSSSSSSSSDDSSSGDSSSTESEVIDLMSYWSEGASIPGLGKTIIQDNGDSLFLGKESALSTLLTINFNYDFSRDHKITLIAEGFTTDSYCYFGSNKIYLEETISYFNLSSLIDEETTGEKSLGFVFKLKDDATKVTISAIRLHQ